ncbi:MAG TPA: exo-alpha-sialidase [Thermoplasmata archaeon]
MARTIKKGSVVLAVGTKKGGFLFHSADRRKWSVAGPHMPGRAVYHMIVDPRDGRTVYAGAPMTAEPWGPAVYRGRIGSELKPSASAPKFKEGSGLSVTRIWHIEPGPADEPETIYAGVEPAALFRSEDRGDTWEGFDALNYHPTRKDWQPGNGGLCLHSVLVDPRKPKHIVIGISAVGTFETKDGGLSWTTENKGVRAEFMPNRYPEMGQCVHKLAWDAAGDGSIFHQNHCGTYHRGPSGGAWTEVSKGLPSDFGFPIAAHPHEKRTAFVAPLTADVNRVFPKGQMAVWKTSNAGERWRRSTKGLPGPNAFMGVLREGMAVDAEDPLGVYVGTNTGQLFASRDEGDSWKMIADFLPPILSVQAAEAR